jgi:hypothetical protein
VAAVGEHGEPHDARPAEVGQRVERRTDGASGVQHVVDEHHDLVVDAARRDVGVHGAAGRLPPQVVAVHRDVEGADGDRGALDLLDEGGQPAGEGHPARRDAQHHEVGRTLVVLEDLVRDAPQDAGHVGLGHDGA